MKREYRLLMTGAAFVALTGMLPAFADDNTKAAPNKPPTAATSADKPAPKPEPTPAQKRADIDKMAKETMDMLFVKSPQAKKLYDKSYGYAVFDNFKLAFLLTGGGGKGVGVQKAGPDKRTYMNMGTVGVGLGLGAHKYQIVFLFETKERFDSFVNEGWTADAAANAVAGEAGANAEASFTKGIAVYQITDAGLMLQADIAGTKYWRDDELNMKHDATD